MKPTADQLARGLRAALDLKDRGPGNGKFPVSFTKNPALYVERIAEAVLADVPEPQCAAGSWMDTTVHADPKPRLRWISNG